VKSRRVYPARLPRAMLQIDRTGAAGNSVVMVIAAAFRAFPAIFHPAALRLLAKTLALTLIIFAVATSRMGRGRLCRSCGNRIGRLCPCLVALPDDRHGDHEPVRR
jgi:hypothetical protein